MVWGNKAIAGMFTREFDSLDINSKELLVVMAGIKHWFPKLANKKVKIFCDNQVCVTILNNGFTRSQFLATCLREIQYFLATYNIEIRAEYVPSKLNYLADLCSRAFMDDVHHENFNKLLQNKTLILDDLFYDNFNFSCKW